MVFLLLKVPVSHFLISQLLYYLKHWSMILQSKSLFKLYAFGKYLAPTLSICSYESVEQVISQMCNESVVAVNVFSLLCSLYCSIQTSQNLHLTHSCGFFHSCFRAASVVVKHSVDILL